MGLFGLTLDVSAEFASRFLTVTEENFLDAESKKTLSDRVAEVLNARQNNFALAA